MNDVFPPPGPMCSPVVTPNLYKALPSPHGLATPSSSHPPTSANLPSPSTGALVGGVPPLSQAGLVLESPQEGQLPVPGTHQGNCPDLVLIESFLSVCSHQCVSSSSDSSLFSRAPSSPDAKRAPSLGPHPEHQLPGLGSCDVDLRAT